VAEPGWSGGSFGSVGLCLLAPNASPMTLDGTNTWVLRAPGSSRSVVVDPGPPHPDHLDAVAHAADDVAVVLLTHHHLDHAEAARAFAERVGCGVRALDPAYRLGAEGLGEGDVVVADDLEIRVVATPGHTTDSLSFVIPSERTVLTGDTVLGRGTTVVAHPDGRLGAYLGSLDRLHALAEAHEIEAIWPGHGPVIDRALPTLDFYIAHRQERLAQVRDALRTLQARARPGVPLDEEALAGVLDHEAPTGLHDHDALPRRIVELVYADVDPVLWPAAELSVRAQLEYLTDR
jgi:glyoxylase-like metal-dependent hydrolase (beta-lactamase superfamily II)